MAKQDFRTWYVRVANVMRKGQTPTYFRLHDQTKQWSMYRGNVGTQDLTTASEVPEPCRIYERELCIVSQLFNGQPWWVIREGSRFIAFPREPLVEGFDDRHRWSQRQHQQLLHFIGFLE